MALGATLLVALGSCSVVKVLADDVVVHMPTATRLVVRGHRNTVDAKSIGSLAGQGSDHAVPPRRSGCSR